MELLLLIWSSELILIHVLMMLLLCGARKLQEPVLDTRIRCPVHSAGVDNPGASFGMIRISTTRHHIPFEHLKDTRRRLLLLRNGRGTCLRRRRRALKL